MNEYQSKLFIECLQSAGITETPIEWNDTLVKEFLLKKNLNYSYIYNQYLIIKYTFEYISLEKNINKYEQAYINFELTHTKKSSEFTIISNLEKIISEVINEYAIARYSILYKNIPHIALPLSLINFNCKVPQELMQDFLQKSTRAQPREQDSLDTLQQITFEKFKLNLKLATIFRCSLLQVTNNARHEPRVGLAAEVPYTDGTTMIINSLLFNLLNDAIFLNKLPDTKPTKLFYKKNLSICDLYDNKNYSYPLWTIKPKNRLTQAFLSKVNVMDKKIKLAELVHTINYLNCVQFVIDENFFFKLKQKIEAGKAFLKVTEYGNTTKSPKYMHTILDDALEITTDETYIADGIILKDCNDYLEFKLINTQIQRLLKYFNGSFYLRYILDNRTRVYVQQWPVNYQLNHFVRHIIKFKEVTSLYSIYRKFFYSKEYLEHKAIYKLWKSNSLDCSRLKEALSKHKVNFNVEPITHKNIPTEAELTQLLFIESMLTVLLSLAPKQVISPQEKITYISGLISQAPNLDNILDESNSLFTEIFNKQEISFLKKKNNSSKYTFQKYGRYLMSRR